jgi:hypothetical protein
MTNGVILFFITNIPFTRRVDASESCWVMLLMLLSIYLNVPFAVVFLPLIYQLSIKKKMRCALAYVLFLLYLCSQL